MSYEPLAINYIAPLAQLAEQDTLNVKVEGSIPSWRTLVSAFNYPSLFSFKPVARVI